MKPPLVARQRERERERKERNESEKYQMETRDV